MTGFKNIDLDKLKDSTFLITGATGMIGKNMVNVLLDLNKKSNLNIHIIAHARNEQKAQKSFDSIKEDNFSIIISDIVDLNPDEHIDYIIHTAGITGGSKQHCDLPLRTISVAIDGTKNILDIAVKNKSKGVVYLSTLEIYGDTGFLEKNKVETDGGFLDPVNIRSSYPESKRMCECLCVAYTKQYGIPTYIARLTSTFGYGVDKEDKRVFAQFANSVIQGSDIVLKSTGETVRNYCDAEDAARSFIYMIINGKAGNAYNVANMNTIISIKDLAQKFVGYSKGKIDLKFDISQDVTKLGYNKTQRNVLDSQKLMGLGWEPIYSLDDTIKRLVEGLVND